MNILRIQNEIERRFLVSRMEIFQFNLEISFFSLFFPRYLYVCNLHLHRVLVVNNIRLYCANQKQQTELFFLFNNCFRTEIEHLLFFTLWSRNCFTLKPKKKNCQFFGGKETFFAISIFFISTNTNNSVFVSSIGFTHETRRTSRSVTTKLMYGKQHTGYKRPTHLLIYSMKSIMAATHIVIYNISNFLDVCVLWV